MVRTAALIIALAIAAPAAAQNTSTQCRWIGSAWSCDSQTRQTSTAPVDQGKMLDAGASIVKPYQPPVRPEPQAAPQPVRLSPPISISHRYGINIEQRDLLLGLLKSCPKNDRENMHLDALPENQRSLASALCYAYDRGRVDEITGASRGN